MRAIVSDDTAQIFESAFELAPTGVAVIGMDGRLMRVNRALCQMLGRQTDELVGSTSAPFTHRDDLKVTATETPARYARSASAICTPMARPCGHRRSAIPSWEPTAKLFASSRTGVETV